MGDVIIFLLSKTQNSRRDKEKEEKESRGLKRKMKVEESVVQYCAWPPGVSVRVCGRRRDVGRR